MMGSPAFPVPFLKRRMRAAWLSPRRSRWITWEPRCPAAGMGTITFSLRQAFSSWEALRRRF